MSDRLTVGRGDRQLDEVGEELAVGLGLRVGPLAADLSLVVVEAVVPDAVVRGEQIAFATQGFR